MCCNGGGNTWHRAHRWIRAARHSGYPVLGDSIRHLLLPTHFYAYARQRTHLRSFVWIAGLTAVDMGSTNIAVETISVALQQTIKASLPAMVGHPPFPPHPCALSPNFIRISGTQPDCTLCSSFPRRENGKATNIGACSSLIAPASSPASGDQPRHCYGKELLLGRLCIAHPAHRGTNPSCHGFQVCAD